MATQSVEAVVFDLGKVLVDWDVDHLYRHLIDDPDERRWFYDTVLTGDDNRSLDAGRPFDDWVAEKSATFPDHVALIEAFRDRWPETVPGDLPDTVAVLADLVAAEVPCYGLTNWSAETFPHAEARFEWLTWLGGVVVSGREGVVKPDRAIFDLCAERFALTPAATVFVDDSPPNVDGARAAGWQALHFTGADRLRTDLRALGLGGI